MGTVTVTGSAQPIYPDGQQDSFVIKNLGPYTVYVDNDSSINTDSHSIPPTGTMVWDPHRPLWMLGSPQGPSQVTITRNSASAVFTNDVDHTLYSGAFQTVFGGQTTVTTPLIECGAYNSLQFRISNSSLKLTSGAPAIPDGNSYYTVRVTWFDSSGNKISSSAYRALPPWDLTGSENPSTVIICDVQGAYFQVDYVCPATQQSAIAVIGYTRRMRQGIYNGRYNTSAWFISGGGSAVPADLSCGILISGSLNYAFYLPCITSHLRLTWRAGVAGAGAANISVLDPTSNLANGVYYDTQAYNADVATLDFYLPLFNPIELLVGSRSGTNTNYLNLTWL